MTNVMQRYWNKLLVILEFVLFYLDAPWLVLTLYIVCISFYVVWTDTSEKNYLSLSLSLSLSQACNMAQKLQTVLGGEIVLN